MNTLSLIVIAVFGVSTFSALLILAACIASARSQRIASQHTAKMAANANPEQRLSRWYKYTRAAGSAGWLRSPNVTR